MSLNKKEYVQAYDNKWFTIKDVEDFYFQCCDCSLTHKMIFEIGKDGKLSMCIAVDKEETQKARSNKGEQN